MILVHDKAEGKMLFEATKRDLIALFGDEIGNWLAPRVAKMFKRVVVDQGQTSHFRACDLADEDQVAVFNEIAAKGYCGSCEKEFHHYRSGRRFRVGFNYGH